jgi:hypothetical protein
MGSNKMRRTRAPRRTWDVERDEGKGSAVGETKNTETEMRTYAVLYVPFVPES